jgi:hypothetical protein
LLVSVTEAANVADCPALRDTEAGPIVTAIGINVTTELAAFVGSALLVAVIVTVCWLAITVGA